jgi:hypothetical protein
MADQTPEKKEKKKGFWGNLMDKLDKQMKEASEKKSCCCCSDDKGKGSSCS